MKKQILFLLFYFCIFSAFAQNEKSESPYFIVRSEKADDMPNMPLLATQADVNIAGVIADVQIKQVYSNSGEHPIEALYVFPASTNAAVYDMKMKVGGRIIQAKIEEKQMARQQYEQAKSAGQRASLLEQDRPNVFQMNVANIMPGDTIEVLLQYTELLIPDQGTYEFVYPAVVGPRYNNTAGNEYANMPYTTKGIAPTYDFDLKVRINGGMPIQEVKTDTHKAHYIMEENDAVRVALAPTEIKTGGNRDFILRYSFRGNEIQTGMLTYDDGDEKFFLCMVQPPKQVNDAKVLPREYVFLIDVSGSMRGYPLSVSKSLVKDLISKLNPNDRFNILLFAGSSQVWAEESQIANQENLQRALDFLNNISGGGGTNLLPALKRSLALNRCREDIARSIIVVTDGYVTVEDEAFDLIRDNLDRSSLFAFGIGSSVNRHLIEGMAKTGQGEPFIVTNESDAYAKASKLRRYIQYPLLTQINTTFDDFEAYDLEPHVVPDVMSERPILLFGKYKGKLKGSINFEGYASKKEQPKKIAFWAKQEVEDRGDLVKLSFDVSKASQDKRNKAIRYLWAREKIKNLSDYSGYGISEEDKKETTRLGLKYNLLTKYTSFIAIEKEVVNPNAEDLKIVKQALPLPEGVENSAVGFDLAITGMSGAELLNATTSGTWVYFLYVFLLALVIIGLLLLLKKKVLPVMLFLCVICLFISCEKEALLQEMSEEQMFTEVSFILGEDGTNSNPYYDIAATYFSTDSLESTPLIIKECKSLHAIRDFLKEKAPTNGAWKRINLVVHGNEWTGINLPVLEGSERCTHESLEASIKRRAIKPLPNSIIDEHTELVVWGCNVGKDEKLLKSMSKALGGRDEQRPMVYAAPYFNYFKKEGHQYSRHLVESRFVAMPAGQFSGNAQLAKQFAKKYPHANIDWKNALVRLHPDDTQKAYTHYFVIPVKWTALYADVKECPSLTTNSDCIAWVNEQEGLKKLLEEMEIKPEDFRWESEASLINDIAALEVEGQTIIYCILSPVIDENNQLITPSIYDERYFHKFK